ncbi:venom metalloproteinase 3-like [Cotesia glomerata]|uniref:venom metalloproteinase 3-like n=1 Tax=Cotesia glomerata TaxID=32391 RepID=UPI001D0207C0|nr:venom metalloproteinase 3-like [Cotesia glomerata]
MAFVLAKSFNNSIPLDQQIQQFIDHECQVEKCDVSKIEWPHVRKRSIDSKILLSIMIFGKSVILNLVPSKNLLVGSNTPVYYLDTQYDFLRIKVKTHIFREEQWELYEDEKEFTSIYVKIYPDGSRRIQFGYVGSELYTIEPVSENFPDSEGSYYLARAYNRIHNITEALIKSWQSISEVVYPELLLIIDNQVYAKYNENQNLFPYLLTFWNVVNLLFRPLRDPRIETSIAGIMIAQDEKVIHYMSGNQYEYKKKNYVCYEEMALTVSKYLYSRQDIIPQDTYDIFFVLTTKPDDNSDDSEFIHGLSIFGGACHIDTSTKELNRAIVMYESNHVTDINVAVHELAHSLNVQHNEDVDISCVFPDTIMSTDLENLSRNWSKCSIDTLRNISRNRKFSCLYNTPNFINPLIDDEQGITRSPNGKWLEFRAVISKEMRELIDPKEFNSNKAIEVSFENNKIVIQLIKKSLSTLRNVSRQYNFIRIVPDDEKIIIDLKSINLMKNINIFYQNKSIHVYQDADEELGGRKNLPTLPPLHISANSEDLITIKTHDLDFNKLIEVFYEDNKLVVTQNIKMMEDEFFSGNDVIDLNKNYVVSDDFKVYIRPFQLNSDQVIRIYHNNTSIYISLSDIGNMND